LPANSDQRCFFLVRAEGTETVLKAGRTFPSAEADVAKKHNACDSPCCGIYRKANEAIRTQQGT